ncbi:hypothetical protein A3F05_01480 [Candidatus Saccharibacteria bacterium RIFCSPHIGHO2_12_FULL_47_17]|nr:MAG: hypothetical protein A3F05_01480 [Candidatus Saccharibacteria bacterium RIFCSPHIGHO2_12_FULL_47_17]
MVNDQPVPDPSSVEKYAILYEDFTRITAARDDSRLKEKLVEDYSGLVRAIAKHYFLAGAERDDLLQEGMIGLVKAIRCYDPEAGTPFKKFAQLCIKRQMITAVHVATRGKHTPLNEARSFGTEITRKDGEVGSLTLEDLLPSSSHTPEEIVIAKDELESLVAMLGTKLSPLESDIFRMFLQGMSYRDMAHAVDGDEKVIDNAIQRVKRKMTAYWASREIIVPQAVVA